MDEPLYEVPVGWKTMRGIGRLGTAAAFTHFEAVLLKNVVEAIVAHGVFVAEFVRVHTPKLPASYAGSFLADTFNKLDHKGLFGQFAHLRVTVFIIGLCTYTK